MTLRFNYLNYLNYLNCLYCAPGASRGSAS
jgi:hypothetical protein